MRRFIAYLLMTLSMILCVGVAVNPVFTKMNPGREFTNGREIVYVLKDKETPAEGVTSIESNEKAAQKVAEEFKSRLDKMYIEDYSVKVQGNDTISVNFSCTDDTDFNYVAKYLSFNGGDFSLSGKNEETRITKDKIFKDVEAYIYRDNDIIPYVVFPVSDSEPIKTLIETVKPSDEKNPSAKVRNRVYNAEENSGEAQETPDIFLWANWVEGDSYEKAEQDPAVTGQKIICQFLSSRIWFEHSKEDAKETELAYLCGFGDEEGNYDAKKLEQANKMANYICNLFNASSYDYEVEYLFAKQSSSGVVYQSIQTKPAGEQLLVFGSDVNIATSFTFIATAVAIVVISLILIMVFRVNSLAVIANTSVSVFVAFIVFFAMGATFNVSAIVGGILITLSSLFTSIAYLTKFKEEVYKGRTIRKANQEASKRMNLLTIDVAVLTAFAGLMAYVLGGVALKPMGIILFFGAVIALVMNLVVFKILMYLVTNTTAFQEKYSYFNIDAKLVPNVMNEEKPTYVAPYENTNFGKAKKPVGALALLLTVASAAVISVFGAINGSPLNTAKATSNNTVLYTTIKADKVSIESENAFEDYVLKNIEIDEKAVEVKENGGVYMSTREEYDYETSIPTKYYIFIVNFDGEIASNAKISYKIGSENYKVDTIDEAVLALVENVEGSESTGYITIKSMVSSETVDVPDQGMVALAAGLTIVGAALYCAFRYRPSRGIALLATSTAVTAITYGVFVASRIGTSAITSIAMPAAAVISILATLYLLNKEKDLVKEEKGHVELERRLEIGEKAVGVSAAPIIYFLTIAAFIAIDFFGIVQVSAFSGIFGALILAVVLSGVLVLIVQGPLANGLARKLSKIRLPQFKRKTTAEKIKLQPKHKTSEPEERVFIGIND